MLSTSAIQFIKAVLRDDIIYTIPFFVARMILYPVVNVNNKLQRQYRKIEEEAEIKEKYQKWQNFTFAEKIKCGKEIVATSGYKGLWEKAENYVIPFTVCRFCEGIIYFMFMRLCLDVYKLDDPLYMLTGLSFFFVNITGSFFLKLFMDIMRDRKDLKSVIAHLAPSHTTFWKQYEVELGYYHMYGLVQGYIQLFTFWYFQPKFFFEIFLYAISRICASLSVQPLALLANWSIENNFDHSKVFHHIIHKDGKMGIFAGARDFVYNEIILSVVMISGFHIMASII